MARCRTQDWVDVLKEQATSAEQKRQLHSVLLGKKKTKAMERKSNFYTSSRTIVRQLDDLESFLLQNQEEYLHFNGPMTSAERDQIDLHSTQLLNALESQTEQLRGLCYDHQDFLSVDQEQDNKDLVEHKFGMVAVIYTRLRRVASVLQHMKSCRVRRTLSEEKNTLNFDHKPLEANELPTQTVSCDPLNLSEEERQDLQLEASAWLKEVETLFDQTRMVEQQLAEISNLQMLFASKVQEQETEIESIHNLGMRSTVHMNRAIQHLSGATHKSVDFRLLVLTFLLTASFALLFLDWYESN